MEGTRRWSHQAGPQSKQPEAARSSRTGGQHSAPVPAGGSAGQDHLQGPRRPAAPSTCSARPGVGHRHSCSAVSFAQSRALSHAPPLPYLHGQEGVSVTYISLWAADQARVCRPLFSSVPEPPKVLTQQPPCHAQQGQTRYAIGRPPKLDLDSVPCSSKSICQQVRQLVHAHVGTLRLAKMQGKGQPTAQSSLRPRSKSSEYRETLPRCG